MVDTEDFVVGKDGKVRCGHCNKVLRGVTEYSLSILSDDTISYTIRGYTRVGNSKSFNPSRREQCNQQ